MQRHQWTTPILTLICLFAVVACGKFTQDSGGSLVNQNSSSLSNSQAAEALSVRPASAASAPAPAKAAAPAPAPTAPAHKASIPERTIEVPNAVPPSDANGLRLTSHEIAESGSVKPTVYYSPKIDEDESTCPKGSRVSLRDAAGTAIVTVCQRTRNICLMEGACEITQDKHVYALNYSGERNGRSVYVPIPQDGCRFGFGVRESCLDPYYTLAADLTKYSPGDVIYVPAVVGLEMPNGSKHNGFFIIRDKGRRIRGRGRFDFFTGFLNWRDGQNPFSRIGISDQNTHIPYYQVTGPRADQIRAQRAFPQLPAHTAVE